MIAPKLSTALVYVAMLMVAIAAMLFYESVVARGLFGLFAVDAVACFVLTKSWRAFAALLIQKPGSPSSSGEENTKM